MSTKLIRKIVATLALLAVSPAISSGRAAAAERTESAALDVASPERALDFGLVLQGTSTRRSISVRSVGGASLTITGISTDPPEYVVDSTGFALTAGQVASVEVTFHPASPGPVPGTLKITSNDPAHPVFTIALSGAGLPAANISVDPASFNESLFTGESVTRTLTIANSGGSDLTWHVGGGGATTLADVLANLDAGYASITAAIPNRFDFSEGDTGYFIDDGGNNMYDGGNVFSTSIGGVLSYTGGAVVTSTLLGQSGRYATKKYPGLFVLVADLQVDVFKISGNLGANGSGNVDGATLPRVVDGVSYLGFVKRVWNTPVPSVNHLIIVESRPNFSHTFASSTDNDLDQLFGLAGVTRLYYLLYAGANGSYIDDGATQAIMGAFFAALGPRWLSTSPTDGTVPAGESTPVDVTFDASALIGGDYNAPIVVTSNDPDQPAVPVPAHLHVTGIPDIDVAPAALDFGSLFIGAVATRTVSVANVGTDVLRVTSVGSDHGDFSADAASLTLAVGETRNLTVTFAPSAPGLVQATLTLRTNDPDEPQVTVSLQGEGVIAPDVSITPASFSESLLAGESVTRALTIENTGGYDLTYKISRRSFQSRTSAPMGGSITSHPTADLPRDGVVALERQNTADADAARPGPAFGSYGAAPQRILLYANDYRFPPGQYYVDRALRALSVPYVAYYYDPYGFRAALESGSWDLVVIDNNNFYYAVSVWSGTLESYLRAGGRALITTFGIDGSGSPPATLWATLGIAPAGNIFTASPVYWWDRANPLFNVPESVPDFTQMIDAYYDDGDVLSVTSPSRAVGGLTPSPEAGRGTIVIAESGRVIVNSFLVAENVSDRDGDGKPDAVELFENELAFLLGPSWLTVNSDGGTVPPGGRVDLTVTFDATGLLGGDYDASIVVTTNDPDESEVSVPAHLHVTGIPDIDVAPAALDFGPLFVGAVATRTVSVANVGTDLLTVTSIGSDHGDFSADASSLTLAVGETRILTLTYAPSAPGPIQAALTLMTNDPDEPHVTVSLRGEGLIAPDVSITPASFSERLFTGESVTRTLTIENTGGSDLTWRATVGGTRSLEDVLASLDSQYASITAAIPNRFDFSEGETGYFIDDGGNDMYDGGNDLATDLGDPVAYTNGGIASSPFFGTAGRYFTRKYPGLFVMVADLDGVYAFGVLGNLGADGGGNADGTTLQSSSGGVPYLGYVKRVWNAMDPSVNHLMIVEERPGLVHEFSTYTDDDSDVLYDLTGSTRLYYLLYAGAGGSYIDDSATQGIMNAFLAAVGPRWLSASPTEGVIPAGGEAAVQVTFDATGLTAADYDAPIVVTSNDPDEPQVTVPAHLDIPCTGTGVGCAPIAVCHDVTLAADALCAGQVTAEQIGAGSRDASGRPVGYSLEPAGPFGLGATPVTLTVTDQDGESSTCTAVVTVLDLTPPELSVHLTPETLWPGNHRMVPVAAEVTAHDNCGATAVVLIAVESSEADDGVGNGDGATIDDVQEAAPGTADFTFLLRAERASGGPGRIYTASYRATDASGNSSTAAGYAVAPHDQGGVVDPLDIRVDRNEAGTIVRWSAVPGAAAYDVIRGRLAAIRETSIVIDLGAVTCVKRRSADVSTAGSEDSVAPVPGEAFFYLVEYDDGTSSSYGEATTTKPRAPGPGACE